MTTQLIEKSEEQPLCIVPIQEMVAVKTKETIREVMKAETSQKRFAGKRTNPFRDREQVFLEMRGMWSQAHSELMKGKIVLDNISNSAFR